MRFTKGERALIVGFLESPQCSESKLAASALAKLEKSELVKAAGRAPGIGWYRAAAAMREVLGTGLALPPRPDDGWQIWMSTRIRSLGLSEADCRTIAKVAKAKGWRPPISFETLIKGADRYLADAQLPLAAPDIGKPDKRDPIEMEDL